MTLWMLVRNNFRSHEARILEFESSSSIFPSGTVVMYGGAASPSGFLLCDGSTVSRTTYADLFAIVGTTFNTGGEAGTDFRLPDARGRGILGNGSGAGLTARTIATMLGVETHPLVTAELPTHSHAITDPGHTHQLPDQHTNTGGGAAAHFVRDDGYANKDASGLTTSSATTGVTCDNTGSGTAHQNMQPSLVLNFLIKT